MSLFGLPQGKSPGPHVKDPSNRQHPTVSDAYSREMYGEAQEQARFGAPARGWYRYSLVGQKHEEKVTKMGLKCSFFQQGVYDATTLSAGAPGLPPGEAGHHGGVRHPNIDIGEAFITRPQLPNFPCSRGTFL